MSCSNAFLSKAFLVGRRVHNVINHFNFPKRLFSYDASLVRNCAIIAHVDHGKTTMMDKLLGFCGTTFSGERAMDSNEHEKERGITIMSKYTRLYYKGHTLHVVDTPGHADFGGEVERILSMVDGVVLLVDASEGPMSQTKFVLSKALLAGKKAIVVLNKIDREGNRAEEVENEIFDLFCGLTNNESQLEYPILYASAKQGWVSDNLSKLPGKDVSQLLDLMISHFPAASNSEQILEPFALSVNTIQTDAHLGRIVTGKVQTGKIAIGDPIKVLAVDGTPKFPESKVTKLFYLEGLNRVDVHEANAGEIVSLTGSEGGVTDTVCNPLCMKAVPAVPISPPVISMTFGPNTSPLSGKEGSKVTSSVIKSRLYKEIENNVTLQLKPSTDAESMDVQGRGELQIGILVETMRREGFELTVSPPNILAITDENGLKQEPVEEVIVDVDPDLTGLVVDSMSNRKGTMVEFKEIGNRSRLIFHTPSRGMLGFRHEILSATRGNATVNSSFSHYSHVKVSDFMGLKKGKLVSMESGKTTGFALDLIQERGQLFVSIGDEVYDGMVIGETSKAGEMDVNPCKAKKVTNMRTTAAEEQVRLTPPKKMNVEEVISYMDEDEVIEVTPKSIRLRKKILDSNARQRYARSQKPNKA